MNNAHSQSDPFNAAVIRYWAMASQHKQQLGAPLHSVNIIRAADAQNGQ